jgi:hypothetical protein
VTPADLKALLEKACPSPHQPTYKQMLVMMPLLIELWEIATRHFDEGEDVDYELEAVVKKLEAI